MPALAGNEGDKINVAEWPSDVPLTPLVARWVRCPAGLMLGGSCPARTGSETTHFRFFPKGTHAKNVGFERATLAGRNLRVASKAEVWPETFAERSSLAGAHFGT
jgi:hypothetical protein